MKLVEQPEPCMRCNRRHYRERERRQCAVETLHSAMRYVVNEHYNRDLCFVGVTRFRWDDEADHETALLLELFWQSRRDELNAMPLR